jgi:hypothetical protein
MFYDAIVDAREATVGAGLLYQWRDKVSMLQDILEGDCKVEMGVSMVGEGTRVQQPCFVACGAEGRIACGLRGQPRRREAGQKCWAHEAAGHGVQVGLDSIGLRVLAGLVEIPHGCQCGRRLELLSFRVSREKEAGACSL